MSPNRSIFVTALRTSSTLAWAWSNKPPAILADPIANNIGTHLDIRCAFGIAADRDSPSTVPVAGAL
jgi:hypothetical protein